MPLYEYVCESTGDVIELLRPMAQADDPVIDPAGRNRAFVRRQSTFQAKGAPQGGAGRSVSLGGGCGCGKPHGSCGSH